MSFRNRALSEAAECLVSLVPVVTHTGFHQQWHIQAGGGVVLDSVPQYEYDETVHKAGALRRAAELAAAYEHDQ